MRQFTCDPTLFTDLLEIVRKTIVRVNDSRENTSGKGRTQSYGIINRPLGGHGIGQCKNNYTNPEILDLGRMIASVLCPEINYTSFMLNQDYVALPHVDKNNIGESLVVGFGDYEGGELVVNDVAHNIRYQPIIMDASKHIHYVKPITSGTKYSIIFFRNKFPKKFYAKYGNDLTYDEMAMLIPPLGPGQVTSQVKIAF